MHQKTDSRTKARESINLDTVANARLHSSTQRVVDEAFAEERLG
ncbi:hypothetical protein [Rhodoplanes elegans]|nr:hypothetical protein [Rhodoplanes elegans]